MLDHDPIDLARGWPSPSLLPASILAAATERVFSDPQIFTLALLYGPDPGYQPLREAIAAWLSESVSSRWTTADHLCISGGSSENLGRVLQVFSDPSVTRNVYMVAPTYHLACRVFEDHGFADRLRAVPEDEWGVDIAYLEACLLKDELEQDGCEQRLTKRPQPTQKHYRHIVYCVPTFSNPSGRTMSLLRREQLLRLARKHDALIISDDVYDMLTWSPTQMPPRFVDIDRTLDNGPTSAWGNAVSNSSFSKILGPGVRTGWATGTYRFIQGLSQCGSTISGGAPSQMLAAVIAQCLMEGTLQRHLENILIPAYQWRCEVARQSIHKHLVPYGVTIDTEVKGGFFLYLHLPKSITANVFVDDAKRHRKTLVEAGEHFAVVGDESTVPCRDGLRICFAWEDDARIKEGIKRMGIVLRRLLGCESQDDSADDDGSSASHSEDSSSGSA